MEGKTAQCHSSKFSNCWTFSISDGGDTTIGDNDAATASIPAAKNDDHHFSSVGLVPAGVKESFARDGFVVFPGVLGKDHVDALNEQLEEILRGRYDRDRSPDKTPKLLKTEYRKKKTSSSASSSPKDDKEAIAKKQASPTDQEKSAIATKKANSNKVSYAAGELGFTGNLQNVKVLQVINVHKADSLFRQLAVSPVLGRVVAELAGWTQVGTRLAQDQIWAKPPGAPPLTFHRDSPYFMFSPPDVVTVWLALDNMHAEIGPLQYVKGSHQWGDGRFGSANQFFASQGGKALLESAAARAGVASSSIVFESMEGLLAGGISIHDGRTWHGSGPNTSCSQPRRGLGLHFVPANVRFTAEATKSSLWKSYVIDSSIDPKEIELPEEDFPITWLPDNRR